MLTEESDGNDTCETKASTEEHNKMDCGDKGFEDMNYLTLGNNDNFCNCDELFCKTLDMT
jgi:hypothetical protein